MYKCSQYFSNNNKIFFLILKIYDFEIKFENIDLGNIIVIYVILVKLQFDEGYCKIVF